MTWIVTGGAGFIGGHVVHLLSRRHHVVVFDDLSTGRPDRLPPDVPVVKGSVTDPDELDKLFEQHPAAGVVHLAARKTALEDAPYRSHNVEGTGNLLTAMARAGVGRLLFASSAAVYGDTGRTPVVEGQPRRPVNPYGVTKDEGERLIAEHGDERLRSLALRQFNVIGAGTHPYAADTGAASLLPAVFRALTDGTELVVRGGDYPTPDGSAVRDYVHVEDVARAYLRGVALLGGRSWQPSRQAVNIGSGRPTSVLDIVRIAGRVAGAELPFRTGERRPGDAAAVIADVGRAERMGFRARRTVEDAVASAWASWRRPAG
ncbi:NAD-dependent epimerase/dehydratase family protein [Actinoplanes palleronii]|uniref:UDP-glucose 4-epimerase n=1 Tax=Actinoplanes palleronii TaxID=113570 RepID=A0ABQ4BT09_9ACTN|nr:NAD-dependent epimerase/dehydratase family protein [Actinoplanes palleronii]GIE73801.1 UDP-glucose 4-epimerase GalE [Actinoplanes palleronii]